MEIELKEGESGYTMGVEEENYVVEATTAGLDARHDEVIDGAPVELAD